MVRHLFFFLTFRHIIISNHTVRIGTAPQQPVLPEGDCLWRNSGPTWWRDPWTHSPAASSQCRPHAECILGRLYLSHQFLDRPWSPWQQPPSQPTMDKQWPFLYKVRKAELDIRFFLCIYYLRFGWNDDTRQARTGKGVECGGETSARRIWYYQHFLSRFFFETKL